MYGSLKRRSISRRPISFSRALISLLDVGRHRLVGLGLEHGGELAGVRGALRQRFPGGEVIADARRLLVEGCGAARIVPEIRVRDLPVELD